MKLRVPGFALRTVVLALLLPFSLAAQTVTLFGTASDAKGRPIANAAVSLKPAAGSPVEVRTDAAGNYSIPNLAPGDYMLSATGEGLSSKPILVTVTNAPHQTVDLLMVPDQEGQKRGRNSRMRLPLRHPRMRRRRPRLKILASRRSRRKAMRSCRPRLKSARACCGSIKSSGCSRRFP